MSKTNLPYDRAAEGPLLKISRVMEILDCSRSFVYKLIRNSELRQIPLSDKRGMRVTEKSLLRFIRRREAKARKEVAA